MESLRWILILAGVAILVLLYVSGRPRAAKRTTDDHHAGEQRAPGSSAHIPNPMINDDVPAGFEDFGNLADDDFARPATGQHAPMGNEPVAYPQSQAVDDYADLAGAPPLVELPTESAHGVAGGIGTIISQKIDAFSQKLPARRKKMMADTEPHMVEEPQPYLARMVNLHIVAPQGRLLDGNQLLELFESRGYHYGEMNIFHSMHKGQTVFSIAKMVEPGYFDINDIESFATPGISLILQLPAPVSADVAFEVLISEAFDMATALGGSVLDADRSTLTKQTVQHMREGIYEFMHRQKYFNTVAS